MQLEQRVYAISTCSNDLQGPIKRMSARICRSIASPAHFHPSESSVVHRDTVALQSRLFCGLFGGRVAVDAVHTALSRHRL